MSRHAELSDINMGKLYIVTQPTRLSDMQFDNADDDGGDLRWQEQSRRLQARRWRQIRNKLA